jgi:hypothetical protein
MAARARQAALAGKDPDGPVREHLLDLGVVAVPLLALEQGERGVGEHRVVAPGGKQLVLARRGLPVEVLDPADDQPGGDGPPLLPGERGVPGLGDPGVGYLAALGY